MGNWRIIAALIERLQPDLVIHTGDVVLHDPDSDSDHAAALTALAELRVPVLCVPGNHDVGDAPSDNPVFGQMVTEARVAAFVQRYGADRWIERLGAWTLIGVNAMLFNSGFEAEAAQWKWLEESLHQANGPVALFMHKPPFLSHWGESGDDAMAIPLAARTRLRVLCAKTRPRFIAVGHRHEYRTYADANGSVIWAPPVGFVIAAPTPPVPDAMPMPGCVLHTLVGDVAIAQPLTPADLTRYDSSFLHAMRAAAGGEEGKARGSAP